CCRERSLRASLQLWSFARLQRPQKAQARAPAAGAWPSPAGPNDSCGAFEKPLSCVVRIAPSPAGMPGGTSHDNKSIAMRPYTPTGKTLECCCSNERAQNRDGQTRRVRRVEEGLMESVRVKRS